MKTIAKLFGWASLAGAVLLLPLEAHAAPLGAMRVRLAEGDVQVRIPDTGEWAPVSVNMPLVEGDELWVPDGGFAALRTSRGDEVRLDENTAFQVLRLDRDSFQFHLSGGRAYMLDSGPRRGVIQWDTPDASVRSFGEATFRIDVPRGETDIAVLRGEVLAENDAGRTEVRAGRMLILTPDGDAAFYPLPAPDRWEDWNARQDRIVLARGGESYRHLPDELRVYSDDFDGNGRWVHVEDYGYCWNPTVLVVGDWAPYRLGRWVWRGGDYVWVGYEPWGWAPYHYGRWTFVGRIGWCWVPPPQGEVYWAPGYVGWVQTGDYVAWVPLAPRETYYGYGDFGRHSVNITNVNVTQVRVTNVYRNVYVNNSVTVINRTTFVTGRPAPVGRNVAANARDNFVQRRNIVPGRPAIKPVGSSYAPVSREVPEAKRPPAAVRRIEVKDLRRNRPLVAEHERSAVRPEARPVPLNVRKGDRPPSRAFGIREEPQVPAAERRVPGAFGTGPKERTEGRGETPARTIPPDRSRREAPPSAPPGKAERGRGFPPGRGPGISGETPGTAAPSVREERGGRPAGISPRGEDRPTRIEDRKERRPARTVAPPAEPETQAGPAEPRGRAVRETDKDRPKGVPAQRPAPGPSRVGSEPAAERPQGKGGRMQSPPRTDREGRESVPGKARSREMKAAPREEPEGGDRPVPPEGGKDRTRDPGRE